LAFYKAPGKLVSVSYQGWDSPKVILEGQVFELCGPTGQVEGRILPKRGRPPRPKLQRSGTALVQAGTMVPSAHNEGTQDRCRVRSHEDLLGEGAEP
jgi:hypothetical protein